MRKWIFGALTALFVLTASCMSLADSEGVVVQSSCNIVQSGDYYLVYCYAQIHNNSSEIIGLEQGEFELHSGDQLLASQEINQIWPLLINPGEDGYTFDVVAFEPDENGQAVIPQVTGINYNIQYMTVESEFASKDLSAVAEIERDERGDMTVLLSVTNGTDVDAYDPMIAFGLYTDGGVMVYADGTTQRNVGIPAGGTMLMRFPLEDAVVEQWDAYGANIAEARVTASFRNDTD